MLNRILIALFFIPIVFYAVYLGGIPFLLLVCGICIAAAYEFWEIMSRMGFVPRKMFGNVFVFLIVVSVFVNNHKMAALASNEITAMIFSAAIILLFAIEVIKYDIRTAVPSLAITFIGIIYVGWLPSHMLLLRDFRPNGFVYVLMLLAVVWISDSVAYFIGTAYGTHKLSPASPKKTVEGAIASVISAILFMIIVKIVYFKALGYHHAIGLGITISIFAQFGDLAESLVKRSGGVKDSSTILKNHGGFLDKLDS